MNMDTKAVGSNLAQVKCLMEKTSKPPKLNWYCYQGFFSMQSHWQCSKTKTFQCKVTDNAVKQKLMQPSWRISDKFCSLPVTWTCVYLCRIYAQHFSLPIVIISYCTVWLVSGYGGEQSRGTSPVIYCEHCSFSKRHVNFSCSCCNHRFAHTSIPLSIDFSFIPAHMKSLLIHVDKLTNEGPPNNILTNQAHLYKCKYWLITLK